MVNSNAIRFLLLSALIALGGPAWAVETRPVKIDSGRIKGEVLAGNPAVRVFRGIPFAAPPVVWLEGPRARLRLAATSRCGGGDAAKAR